MFLYSNEYFIDIVHHITGLQTNRDTSNSTSTDNKLTAVTSSGDTADNERTSNNKETTLPPPPPPPPPLLPGVTEPQKQVPAQVTVVSSLVPVMTATNGTSNGTSSMVDSVWSTQSTNQRQWTNTNRTKEFIENSRSYIGPQLPITIN